MCTALFLLSGIFVFPYESMAQSEDDWFLNSYRKLFFDFHTHSAVVDVAEGFDADRWADELVKSHVQAISLHTVCGYGWRYYREGKHGWVHPNLPEDLDLVGEMVRACHERDIKVIGYFFPRKSEMITKQHPEWLIKDKEGKPLADRISFLSPYFKEILFPMLEEYASNYDVDGVFFDGFYESWISHDSYTREKFKKDTGKELPDGETDPVYKTYVSWIQKEVRKLHQQALDAVHRGRERTLVAFNWNYTPRQPKIPLEDVGFLSLDIFPQDQVYTASYIAKYWVTLNKPFDIMNSAHLQWWGGRGVKPPESLMQECATTIANGGRTWIGYQYDAYYDVEPELMDVYKQTFEFVMEREDYCNGAAPVPYIAVLHSSNGFFTHGPTLKIDETRLNACFKMLMESGFHFNVVNEKTLLQTLMEYKLVILPDQRYLEQELVSALREFVRNGGSIIASSRTGTQDASYEPTGKFVLEDLLGVELENQIYPYDHSYIKITDDRLKKDVLDMPQQAFGEVVFVRPSSAHELAALWDLYIRSDGEYLHGNSPPGGNTGFPAITVNSYGKGQAAYIAQDIFYAYNKCGQWNLKNMFRNLVNELIDEKLVEIEAPGMVEVVLNSKGENLHLNLVNHYREKPTKESNSIAEKIVPVYDIGVRVKSIKPVKSITLVPGDVSVEYKIRDGYVSFTVPKLHIHTIAVIER